MTTPGYSHLPNAKHIDRILDDLRLRPKAWGAAWGTVWNAARDAARDAAWNAARDAAWDAARGAARDAARGAAWNAARDAVWGAARDAAWGGILALLAWDDCAYILDLHPNVVRLMAASGNQPAILLESAVIAMHKERV